MFIIPKEDYEKLSSSDLFLVISKRHTESNTDFCFRSRIWIELSLFNTFSQLFWPNNHIGAVCSDKIVSFYRISIDLKNFHGHMMGKTLISGFFFWGLPFN